MCIRDRSSIGSIDEPNSLTCIEDFSLMIDHLLGIDATGVYNCANPGLVSPLEIARSVKEFLNPNLEVKEVSYEELLKILPNRRVNTILSIEKLSRIRFISEIRSLVVFSIVSPYGFDLPHPL